MAVLLGSAALLVAGIVVHKKNNEKRFTRLFYELDDVEHTKHSIVQGAMMNLSQSHVIWRVNAESATSDWKRNAGASSLVRRSHISAGCSNPERVATNVPVPCLNLGQVRLFFCRT
jgi:hypothetical protein